MTETGTCSNKVFTCKAGHFCPAEDSRTVNCKPCSEGMFFGQGCYCEANTPIYNCQECKGKQCSKCMPQTFLQNNKCEYCPLDCDICENRNSCITCSNGYKKHPQTGNCEQSCENSDGCLNIGQGFCNPATQICQSCIENCVKCSSGTTCHFCNPDISIITVEGQCTKKCQNIQNGNYCKDGVPTACGEGLTSECKCGKASNCASCNQTQDKCQMCLPHWKFDSSGKCAKCEDGYKLRSQMCWLSENSDPPVINTLGGGAITGIIIAVVIVVGVVCVGTFLFMKKKVYNVAVEIRNNLK